MDVSVLKARSFLGFMSIRSGLIVVAFLQILVGVFLFMSFKFLRPSLVIPAWFLLITNCFSAILGIWGLWRRSQPIEIIYLATFIVSLLFLLLVVLSFSDTVELLPPAPKGAAEGFREYDVIDANYKDRAKAAFNRLRHNPVFARVLDNIYINKQEEEEEQEEKEEQEEEQQQQQEEKRIIKEKKEEKKKKKIINDFFIDFYLPHVADLPKIEIPDYEHMPFVPHANQTAGENGEVSVGELPPDFKKLSTSQKDEVLAIAKMQKRPFQLGIAGALSLAMLFEVYCVWIILTFIMNKCMSFDELIGAEEQFEPLVGMQ